jgi:hypothetical protein
MAISILILKWFTISKSDRYVLLMEIVLNGENNFFQKKFGRLGKWLYLCSRFSSKMAG